MGTRHALAFFDEGEFKVAQYNQWDGYPDGNGLDFLRKVRENDLDMLRRKVNACHWLTEDEIEELNKNDNWSEEYPWLSRDCSANIVDYLMESQGLGLFDRSGFFYEGLYCEWGYLVDFEKGTFEVYEGFNQEPNDETHRFISEGVDSEYHPVRLVKSYPLDDLPTDERFLADLM